MFFLSVVSHTISEATCKQMMSHEICEIQKGSGEISHQISDKIKNYQYLNYICPSLVGHKVSLSGTTSN